jgi:serine/threonine-protein kinase
MKIIVQPLPVPSQVAEVPPGFDRWWGRASQRDPAGRFQSAKEFAESLQMVFGASQATDVMDRSMLKGVLGSTPQPGALPNAMMLTPSGPQMAPYMSTGAPLNALAATTGAPIARTFNEGDASPTPAKKGNGLAIGIASAAVVVALSAVGVLAMRGRSAPSAASAPVLPAETAHVAPPAVVPPTETPTPVAVAAANPTATALELPATAPTPTPAPPKEPTHHHSSGDTSRAAAPKPAAPAPAGKPAAKAASDLGF